MAYPADSVPIQGVILDMDGVLVDSEPFILRAAAQTFASKGYRVQPEDFVPFIGTGEDHLLGGVAAKYGIPFDAPADKAATYAIYLHMIQGKLKPLPGALEFIGDCRRRGLKLAVASSADEIKVEGNLEALGLTFASFDAVVDGSMIARKKPDPDIFLAAAERLRLEPGLCLVVEDAVAGVAAAKAAGARCLALTTSFPAERLTAADWIAPNLAAVPDAVYETFRA